MACLDARYEIDMSLRFWPVIRPFSYSTFGSHFPQQLASTPRLILILFFLLYFIPSSSNDRRLRLISSKRWVTSSSDICSAQGEINLFRNCFKPSCLISRHLIRHTSTTIYGLTAPGARHCSVTPHPVVSSHRDRSSRRAASTAVHKET